MELQITLKELENDEFLTIREAYQCYEWLKNVVIRMHPEDNTHEKLLEYVQLFREMMFQST